MGQKQLKTIFFDIDDTLYSTTEFTRLARRESIEAMINNGLDMDPESLTAILNDVTEEFPNNYEHHFDQLLKRIPPERILHNKDIIAAAAIVAHHKAKHRHLSIYEDALHVIRDLAETPLTLGVISSGLTVKQAEKVVRLGIQPYLAPNAIFISEETGFQKTDPALYRLACKAVNSEPKHCMIIGDNPTNDIDPPNSIGMITVLKRRSGKYVNEVGESEPDYLIHNFWDLDDILQKDFCYA